jgi:hypothetical protein
MTVVYCQSVGGGDGFRNHFMGRRGFHENLHQVIHCLNKYRGVEFDNIELERWRDRSNHWDFLQRLQKTQQ